MDNLIVTLSQYIYAVLRSDLQRLVVPGGREGASPFHYSMPCNAFIKMTPHDSWFSRDDTVFEKCCRLDMWYCIKTEDKTLESQLCDSDSPLSFFARTDRSLEGMQHIFRWQTGILEESEVTEEDAREAIRTIKNHVKELSRWGDSKGYVQLKKDLEKTGRPCNAVDLIPLINKLLDFRSGGPRLSSHGYSKMQKFIETS